MSATERTTYQTYDTTTGNTRRLVIHGDGKHTPLADLLRQLADHLERDHRCLLDLSSLEVVRYAGRAIPVAIAVELAE